MMKDYLCGTEKYNQISEKDICCGDHIMQTSVNEYIINNYRYVFVNELKHQKKIYIKTKS